MTLSTPADGWAAEQSRALAHPQVDVPADETTPDVSPLPLLEPWVAPRHAVRVRDRLAGLVVDTSAALLALAAVSATGLAPAPRTTAALLLVWLALMTVSSRWRPLPFGGALAARAHAVARATTVVGLTVWVAHAVGVGRVDPDRTVPLVAALGATGLVVAPLLAWHRQAPRVVVAGDPDQVRTALGDLAHARRPVQTVAVCLTEDAGRCFDGLPVHVGIASTADVAAQHRADGMLVLPGPVADGRLVRRLMWQAARDDRAFYLGTGLLDVDPARVTGARAGDIGALCVQPAPLSGARRLLKDVLERLVAATFLLLLLPALVVVGVAIRCGSPGGAIFRQQRVGRRGVVFTMYKFRTMAESACDDIAVLEGDNDVDGCLFKLRSDPRVTPLGALLRRYSIDEIPQLWNVVVGQMSLVGPRPALPDEVARYDLDPHRRLAVKPGLTGLWQVSGRSELTWEQTVRLDLRYVDNWSLTLDLSILRRTVRAVLAHRGAY